MTLQHALVLLTLVSVVADTMLLPFYPQFFASAFGNPSPEHAGSYIAACCLTVMVALPFWAKVARSISEVPLWVMTQLAAAILALAAFCTPTLVGFWIITQVMLLFKASYLLIYPYAMRLAEKERHLGMAGLFTVLVHCGAIGGAVLGGWILEFASPRVVYLVMAASDVLQAGVCACMIRSHWIPWRQVLARHTPQEPREQGDLAKRGNPMIVHLGVVSLLFSLSGFVMRPFFAPWWATTSGRHSELLAGVVYAIPAWVALVGLWLNRRATKGCSSYAAIFQALILAMLGAAVQGIGQPMAIIAGRILYGWALFRGTVHLEVLVFALSSRQHYAMDFSRINIFQNVGVLLASSAAGFVVSGFGLRMPFVAALGGFAVTWLVFVIMFGRRLWPSLARLPSA